LSTMSMMMPTLVLLSRTRTLPPTLFLNRSIAAVELVMKRVPP
jgi:hypothetical protein